MPGVLVSTTSQITEVLLPELGESVTEGTVVEWRHAVGDVVDVGDILLDLTTDKVDVEVPSPVAGVITAIHAVADDTIEVGSVLAEISAHTDGVAPPAAAAPVAAPSGPAEVVGVHVPELGESVTEGVVVGWSVPVGTAVEAGQTLLELTTDKVDVEIPATVAGVLTRQAVAADDTVEIGTLLGEITVGAAGTSPAPVAAPAAPAAPAAGTYQGVDYSAQTGGPPATPVARRMAAEAGVDLRTVTGTGPSGMIRKDDIAHASNGGSAAPAPTAAGEEAIPLRGPAAALASYMDQSLSIPTATSFRTLGVATLDAMRRSINADLAAANRNEKLSFTHLIAWAIVKAAQRWPVMGTGYERRDGKPYKLERHVTNLGLAVDVERKDGSRSLMVPVVKDSGVGGFTLFRDGYDDVVKRTRFGGITPDELRGANITLTNPGGLGTVASVPRLMPGQGTIVATGSIAYPAGLGAMSPDKLRELGVEKVMTITSTYDHRVVQGAESGGFLAQIDALLQGDEGFYDEVRTSLGLAPTSVTPSIPAAVAPPVERRAASTAPDLDLMNAVSAAMSVIKATRSHGHLAASLDPLGSAPPGDPALDPERIGLTPEMMAKLPAAVLRVNVPGESFLAALPNLRQAYCGNIAYEVEHISDHQQRLWWREVIESGVMNPPLSPERRMAILERLLQVDAFERFLRRQYLGQKTFSIEGVDTLVPLVDEIIELVAEAGSQEVVLGMAHRGRLSFITHVVGRPVETILAEFEGHMEFQTEDEDSGDQQSAGDVKYHLGAEGTFVTRAGRPVTVSLAANPSHLEQVNAVVEGHTRARQTTRTGQTMQHDPQVAVPVLIHGDAAFPGQGVVAETLNLQALRGYSTGGTIHVIANNQIGFTTDPSDSRSSQHASDLARGFDIPVIHVNADDVEACLVASRMAVAFRATYGRDVLIDLVGYRRLGHNEVDEPAYTQPVMTRTIKAHPPVSKVYGKVLIAQGLLNEAGFNEMLGAAEERMTAAHRAVTSGYEANGHDENGKLPLRGEFTTAVAADLLSALNEQLLTVPDGFTIHPKLVPQMARRREAMRPEGGIAWAHAESLALASLLVEGVPVRLSGQDVGRGTFSQRHLELHDVGEGETWTPRTGRIFVPLANLPEATATLELYNSPLSEAAALGFEYGYSTTAPEALVLWEAQYGDFANGAQIMIDQFIVSGRVKWGEQSRLTLLLPHGYEGNGPEHSSARIERFLQLAAEDNIRVANCSTAAQYFHLLRKQALADRQRPLIIFTPKSLLRAKTAASTLTDLTDGHFQHVIDDPSVTDGVRADVKTLILCSGKIFHELSGYSARAERADLAIGRIEMLYPFPDRSVTELFATYPGLEKVLWVQEEPQNMGAWEFVQRLIEAVLPAGVTLDYEGRDRRASSSEGYPQAHQAEQDRIITEALRPGR